MKPLIKNMLIVLLALVAISIAYVAFTSTQQVAADIKFTDIDGNTHQLSDYKGQPVLMIFWATDCPGCIKEMPELIELHHQYAAQGLQMIGVAMPHDRPEHIQAMRRDKNIPYTITWDETGAIARTFDNVRVTPTHFLISPEGEIVMRKIGEMKMDQLKERFAMMGIEPIQS